MARDYGRNRAMRSKTSGSKQFLQVFLAFLIGYLTASVFDFASLTHWLNNKWLTQPQEAAKASQTAKPAELPKPKFEFYTLLANGRTAPSTIAPVKSQNAPITSAQTPPPAVAVAQSVVPSAPVVENKPISLQNNKEAFILQVGSFRTQPEAERMKASLILKGFSVNIVTHTQPLGTWYRVVIGPYASHTQAQQVQIAFAKNEHVKGMIRKL